MSEREATIVVWIVLSGLFVGLELVARMSGRIATAGTTVALLLRHVPGRLSLAIGWMWLGWHVFCR